MGGHGALICYLKNPGLYKSVSVFAPICNPSLSSTCIKAFKEYLGDEEEWKVFTLFSKPKILFIGVHQKHSYFLTIAITKFIL